MTRNLADLKLECSVQEITATQAGNREAKSDYETALRDFYWQRDHKGEEMPEQILPMLARNVKDVDDNLREEMLADGGRWVSQEKINGCRAIIKFRHGKPNHITSRRLSDEHYRLNELHDKMPHYRDIELGAEWDDTVIDGEVLMPVHVVDTRIFDGKGQVTVDILQATAATMNCDPVKSIAIQDKYGKLVLHVFDCLRYRGHDIRELPYAVYDCDGLLDLTVESRFLYAMKTVEAVVETIGLLPCEHCTGERPESLPDVEDAPQCEQDNFMDLLAGN